MYYCYMYVLVSCLISFKFDYLLLYISSIVSRLSQCCYVDYLPMYI